MFVAMATVSLSPQQYQQMIDRIAGLESMMTNLLSHADSQQEQTRLAKSVIQQLRTAGTSTNPPPPARGASEKQVTEGAFKALTKYVGNPSEYHDWAFSARRVLTRADKRFAGLLQWISGTIDEIKKSDVMEYQTPMDLSTVDLNSELYALLALKTSDAALASTVSLEQFEAKGIIGWQRLEREARGYHNQRVSLLTESVTHPERVQKAADLHQSHDRWQSCLNEFQRARPTGLDDDVKANAMRHTMPKEILDAVNLQPQHRTFVEIRDYMWRQRADVFVRDVCPATKKVVTTPSRVNTSKNIPQPRRILLLFQWMCLK